jgi:hypothetical protein
MADDRHEKSELAGEPGSYSSLSRSRLLLLGLSVVSLLVCAAGGVLHYLNLVWGNPWQVTGWLLGMLFLLLAFSPRPGEIARRSRALLNRKTVFLVFWILVFTISRLWHFRSAPWNGNALFDESGWDLYFLKHYVIGHPYQAAWYHQMISRETLFHYYVWPFLTLFGYNILSYQVALFGIWCATFLFTLLLVDLFFDSRVVTAISAVIFSFLPFSFIYTFAGYRYPMATALSVASVYFLHLGFKSGSSFFLSIGGVTAGLCWASAISGKQYLFGLLLCGIIYTGFHWRTAKAHFKWAVPVIAYGCLIAAMPLICYIAFNWANYTFWERVLLHESVHAGLGYRAVQLWKCFFKLPGERFFIADALPIPLPYYCFLVPGLILATLRKRYEIVLLAIIPVVGAFLAAPFEHRLLLAIPYWIILMAFTLGSFEQMKLHFRFKAVLWVASALVIWAGLAPSVQFIYTKAEDPWSIRFFAQGQVAVSRFLRHVVAGQQPENPPRLERNEFNRMKGIPNPSYDTFICQNEAYSILHLFLHDYDDSKILSFCAGWCCMMLTEQQIWGANKTALLNYNPSGKGLKLIWERGEKTQRIINLCQPLRDIGREEFYSLNEKNFYILTFDSINLGKLQERVKALPGTLP